MSESDSQPNQHGPSGSDPLLLAIDSLLEEVSHGRLDLAGLTAALRSLVEARSTAVVVTGQGESDPVGDPTIVSIDGLSGGRPHHGGWAWVRHVDGVFQRGHLTRASHQAAELVALAAALEAHASVPHLEIRCDSVYVIGTYTTWMDSARDRGWKNSYGLPTANRPIIERLLLARGDRRAAGLAPVRLRRVRAHGADPGNAAAEALAAVARAEEGDEVRSGRLEPAVVAALAAGPAQ